jgi:hypothetical protein
LLAQVEPCWSTTTLLSDLVVGQLFCISTWTPERVEQLRQSATQAVEMTEQLRDSATEACQRAAVTVASTKASREERRREAGHARDGGSGASSPPGSGDCDSRAVGD